MLKRILCTLCALIILIPLAIVPASAEDTTSPTHSGSSGSFGDDLKDVNLWTYESWKDYLSADYAKSLEIDKLRECSKKDIISVFRFDKNFISDSSFLKSSFWYLVDGDYYFSDSALEDEANLNVSGDYCQYYSVSDEFSEWRNTEFSNLFSVSYSGTYSDNYCYIVDDIEVYKSLVAKFSNNPCKDQIYYCEDIIQSFMDYIEFVKYDDMFFDVYPVGDGCKNIIRFYDCFDSYYGKYQYDFYEDNMLNYLNSSFSINSPIYYQPKGIDTNHQLDGADLQHNEMYYIYIPVPDDFTISQTNEYLTSIGSAIHYEKGPMDFSTWYSTYIKPWLSKFSANSDYRIVTLRDVEPSTTDNPTVNITDKKQDIKLLRLTFPSAYTFLESSQDDGGFIMTGCRTMSTGQKVNLSNGSVDNTAKDGIGSNIDGGDYLDEKDKDDLLANGWKSGYPNRSNYSYKITVNKNGYILYEIYFDRKPVVKSNFYSDSQIAYDVDFNLTRGYFYAKQQNCYIDFNFRDKNEDDYLYSDGSFMDEPTDDIKKSMANKFAQIVDCFINGVGYFTQEDYEYVNYEKYLTEKIIRIWTNYTGQLTGTYRGYYVQFNWDLEQDKNFIKNNSDDDHNYSDDFLDDGDGFKDNNGNIHGGGTSTDTSLDTSIDDDFNFDKEFEVNTESLTNMINNFLKLLTKIFSVFPKWVWAVLFIGFSIIVACRLLGR